MLKEGAPSICSVFVHLLPPRGHGARDQLQAYGQRWRCGLNADLNFQKKKAARCVSYAAFDLKNWSG